jgi:hypothetical protein
MDKIMDLDTDIDIDMNMDKDMNRDGHRHRNFVNVCIRDCTKFKNKCTIGILAHGLFLTCRGK